METTGHSRTLFTNEVQQPTNISRCDNIKQQQQQQLDDK